MMNCIECPWFESCDELDESCCISDELNRVKTELEEMEENKMEKELVWTNEDAIKMLKSKMDGSVDTSYEWVETVRLAINALEGKKKREMTNEDAIKMLANARYADDLQGNEDLTTAHYMAIEALMPTEKEEPAEWIVNTDESRRWDRVRYYCSACNDWNTYGKSKYCPNCGRRMQSEG